MTLDRTKKYKVGETRFMHSDDGWMSDRGIYYLTDAELSALNPVEVEEPLKWSFELETSALDKLGDKFAIKAPVETYKGNWRHEVVSTRIG